ncbi:MAG: hypothetical protein K9L74_00470 [Candidatus Izimaplasma sp.]|nr:hypothetical protein [Candidatus Izimaplasma bacterium]
MTHKKVYSEFQIKLISFYITAFMLVPIIVVVAYLFNLSTYTSRNIIIFIATIILIIYLVVGLSYLLLKRDYFERRIKPSYQKEFSILLFICGIGNFGFGIIFTYIGGQVFYIPHVLFPLFISVYTGLYFLGKRYYNVSLIQN